MAAPRRHIDCYADGRHISDRRRQKAAILAEALAELFPAGDDLLLADLGCADGALPVLLLTAPLGARIRHILGATLLDYNDLAEKAAHTHPRFRRVVQDLSQPWDSADLPWGACDAVLATAFFHYFDHPEVPFGHAFRLLKPGGYLLAGMPAPWVLRLRRRGVPGLLARNRRIRCTPSLDAWGRTAVACGFTEVSRRAVQWCGVRATDALERWLRRHRLLSWLGGNYLVVYRKPPSVLHNASMPS
jgi:SAM-dependent methyltransferase